MFRLQFKILRKTHLLTPDVFQRYKNTPSCSLKRHLYNHLKVPMSRKLSKLLNIFNKHNQKWSTFNYHNNTDLKKFTNVNFSKSIVHKISKFKNCKSKKSVALLKKITKAISSKKCIIKKCGVRSNKNSKECSCNNKLPKDSLLIKIELPKEEYTIAKPFSNPACLTKIRSYNTLCAKYSKLQHILSKISRNNYKLRHCSNKFKDDDKLFRSKGKIKKSNSNRQKSSKKGTDTKTSHVKSEGDCLMNNHINSDKNTLHELPNHHSSCVAKMKKNNIPYNPEKRNRKKIINIIIEISGTDNDYPHQFLNSTKRTINILNDVDPEEVTNKNTYEKLDLSKDIKFAPKKHENILPFANKQKMEEIHSSSDPTKIPIVENKNIISSYIECESKNQETPTDKEFTGSSKQHENILPSNYKTKNAYDSKYISKENNFSVDCRSKKNNNITLESDVKINQSNFDAESKMNSKYYKDSAALDAKAECNNEFTESLYTEAYDQSKLDSSKFQAVHNKHRKFAHSGLKINPENNHNKSKYVSNTNNDVFKIMHSKNLNIKSEVKKDFLSFSNSKNVEMNSAELTKKTQENKAKLNLKNKTADHKKWLKFLQQKNKNFKNIKHVKNENSAKRDSEIHWISFKSEFNNTNPIKPSSALSESQNQNNMTKFESNKNKNISFPYSETKANSIEKNSCKCNLVGNSSLNKNRDKYQNITENDLQTETDKTNYNPRQCSLHDTEKNIYSMVDKPVMFENTSFSYPELKPENRNTQESLQKNQSNFSGTKNINLVAKKSEMENESIIKQSISCSSYNFTETEYKKINNKKSLKSEITDNVNICSLSNLNNNENQNFNAKDKADCLSMNTIKSETIKTEIINSPVSVLKTNYKSNITEHKADSLPKKIIFNSKMESKSPITTSEIASNSKKNTSSINVSSCFKTEMNKLNSNKWSKLQPKPNETQNISGVNMQNNIAANEALTMSYNTNETGNQNISKTNTIKFKTIENNISSKDINPTRKYFTRNKLETGPNMPNILSTANENSSQQNVAFNMSGFTNEAEIKKTNTNHLYSATETKNQMFNITDCINPSCSNGIQNKENTNIIESETPEIHNKNKNIAKPEQIQTQNNCIKTDSKNSSDPINIDSIQNNIKLESNNISSSYSEMQSGYQNVNSETNNVNQNINEQQSKSDQTEITTPLENQVDQMTNINEQPESNKHKISNNIKKENTNSFKLNESEVNNTENITSSDIQTKIDLNPIPNTPLNSEKVEPQITNESTVIVGKPEYMQNNKTCLTQNEFEFEPEHKNKMIKKYIKDMLLKKVKPDHRVFKVRPYVKQQYCYEEITPQYLQKSLDLQLTNAQMNHSENVTSLGCNEQLHIVNSKIINKCTSLENTPNMSNVVSNPKTRDFEEKTHKQLNTELQSENKLKTEKTEEKSAKAPKTNNQEIALNANSKQLNKKIEKEPESKLITKSKIPEIKLKESVNKCEFKNENIQSHNKSSFEPTKNKDILSTNKNETCSSEPNQNVIASPSQDKKIVQENYEAKIATSIKINNEKQGSNSITEDQSGFKCKKTAATNKLSANTGSVIVTENESAQKMKLCTNNFSLDNNTESANPEMKITELKTSSKSTDEITSSKQDKINLERATTQITSPSVSPTNYAINKTTKIPTNNKNSTEIEMSQKKSNTSTIEANNKSKENKQALLAALIKFNNLLSKEVTKAIEIDSGRINITTELYSQLKKLKNILKVESDKGKRNYGIRHNDANQIEYETIKAGLLNALVKFNNNKSNIVPKQEMNKKPTANNKSNIDANYIETQPDKAISMSKSNQVSIKITHNNSKIKKTKKHFRRIKYIVTRKFNKIIGNKCNPKIKRHKFESDKDNDNDNKVKKSKIKNKASSTNNLNNKKSYFLMKSFQFNQNNITRSNGIDKQNYNKNQLHTAPAIYSNFSSKGPNNNDENETDNKNQKSHNKPELFKIKSGRPEDYINRYSLVNTAPGVYKVPDKQTKYTKPNEESNNNKISSYQSGDKIEGAKKCSKRYNFYTTLKPNEKYKVKNTDNSLSKAKLQAYTGFENNFSDKNSLGKKDSINAKRNKMVNKYQYNSLRQQYPTQTSGFQVKAKNTFGIKKLLKKSLSKKSVIDANNQSFNNSGDSKANDDYIIKKSSTDVGKALNKTQIFSNTPKEDDNKALNKIPFFSNIAKDNDNKALNKVQMVSNMANDDNKALNKVKMVSNIAKDNNIALNQVQMVSNNAKEDDNKTLNKVQMVSNMANDDNKALNKVPMVSNIAKENDNKTLNNIPFFSNIAKVDDNKALNNVQIFSNIDKALNKVQMVSNVTKKDDNKDLNKNQMFSNITTEADDKVLNKLQMVANITSDKNKIETVNVKEKSKSILSTEIKIKSDQFNNPKNDSTTKDNSFNNRSHKIPENQILGKLNANKSEQGHINKPSPAPSIKVNDQVNDFNKVDTKYKYIIPNEPYYIKEVQVTNEMDKVKVLEHNDNKVPTEPIMLIDGHSDNIGTRNINRNNNNQGKINIQEKHSVPTGKAKSTLETGVNPGFKIKVRKTDLDSKDKSIIENNDKLDNQLNNVSTEPVINKNKQTIEINIKTDDPKSVTTIPKITELQEASKEKSILITEPVNNNPDPNNSKKDQNKNKIEVVKSREEILRPKVKLNNIDIFETPKIENKNKLEVTKSETQIITDDAASKPKDLFNKDLPSSTNIQDKNKMEAVKPAEDKPTENQNMNKLDILKTEQDTTDKFSETNISPDNPLKSFIRVSTKYKYPFTNVPYSNKVDQTENKIEIVKSVEDDNTNLSSPRTDLKIIHDEKSTNTISTSENFPFSSESYQTTENYNKNKLETVQSEQENTDSDYLEDKVLLDNQVSAESTFKMDVKNPKHDNSKKSILEIKTIDNSTESENNYLYTSSTSKSGDHQNEFPPKKTEQVEKNKSSLGNLIETDRRNAIMRDEIKSETKKSADESKNKLSSKIKTNNDGNIENQLKNIDKRNVIEDQIKLDIKKSAQNNKDKLSSEAKLKNNQTSQNNLFPSDSNKPPETKLKNDQTSQNNNLFPSDSNKPLETKLNTVEQINKAVIISKKEEPQESKAKSMLSSETVHKTKKIENDSTYLHPTSSSKSSKDQDKKILEIIKSGQNILSSEEKIQKDVHLNNIKMKNKDDLEANKSKTQANTSYDAFNDISKQNYFFNNEPYKSEEIQDKNKMEAEKSVKDNIAPETKIKIEYQLRNMKSDSYSNETYKTTENQNKFDAVRSEQETILKSPPPETNTNLSNEAYHGNAYTKYKYMHPKEPFRNKASQNQNMVTGKPVEEDKNLPTPETELKTFREVKNTTNLSTAYNYSYPIGAYSNINNYNKNKMESNNMYSPESNMKSDYQGHNFPAVQNYSYPNQFHQSNQTMGNNMQNKLDINKSGQERETSYVTKYPTTTQSNIERVHSYSFVHTPIKQNYNNTIGNTYEQGSKSHSHFKSVELGSIVNDVEPKTSAYDPVDKFDLPTYLVSRTQNQKDTYDAIKNENKTNECIFKYFNESENDSHLDEYDRPNYYSFTPNEDYPDTEYSVLSTQKNVNTSAPQEEKNTLQAKSTTYNDMDSYDLPTYDYANEYSDTDSQKIFPKSVIVFQQNSDVPFRAENAQNTESQIKPKSEQVNPALYTTPFVNNTFEVKQNIIKEDVNSNRPSINDIVSFATKSKVDDNLDEYDRPTYNINNEIYKSKPDIIRVEKYQLLKDDQGNYNLEMKYQYINAVDNSVVNVHEQAASHAAAKQTNYARQMEEHSMVEHNKHKKQEESMEYENNVNNSNNFSTAPTTPPPANPYNAENNTEQETFYKYNKAFPITQPKRKKIRLGKYQDTLNMEDQKYLENLNNLRSETANSIINSHKKPRSPRNISSKNKKHLSGNTDDGSQNSNPDKKMSNRDPGFENNSTSSRMLSQSSFYNQGLEMVNKGGNKKDNFHAVIAANLVNTKFKPNNESLLQNWAIDHKIKEIDKKISAPDKFISKSRRNSITDDLLNSLKFPLSGDIDFEPKIETKKKDIFNSLTDEELRLKLEDIKAKSELVLENLELEKKIKKIQAIAGAETPQYVYKLPLKEKISIAEKPTKKIVVEDIKFMSVFRSANTDYVNYSNNALKNKGYQYLNLGNQTDHVIPVCHSGPAPFRNKYCINPNLWSYNENEKNEELNLCKNVETKTEVESAAPSSSLKNLEEICEPLETETVSNNIETKANNNIEHEFQSELTVSDDNFNVKYAFHSGPSLYMNIKPAISDRDSILCNIPIGIPENNSDSKLHLNIEDCAFTLNQCYELDNQIDEVKLVETEDDKVDVRCQNRNSTQSENRIDEVEFTNSGDIIVNGNTENENLLCVNQEESNMDRIYIEPLIRPLEIPNLQSGTQSVNYDKNNDCNNNTDTIFYPQNYTTISCTSLQPEMPTPDQSYFERDFQFPPQTTPVYVTADQITVNQIIDNDEGPKIKRNEFICNPAVNRSFEQKPKKLKKTRIRTSVPSKKVTKTFKQNNDLMRTLMSKTLIRHSSVPAVNMSNQAQNNVQVSTVPEWLENTNDIFPSYIQEEKNAEYQSSLTNDIKSDSQYCSNESACQYADILQMFHPRCTKTVVRRRKPRIDSTNSRYSSREYSYFLTGHLNAPLDSLSNNKVPNNRKHYFSSISNKQLETTEIKNKISSASKLNNDVINTSIQESNSVNKLLLSDQKYFACNESNNPKLLDRIISSYAEICSENEESTIIPKEQNDESNNILGKLIISITPKEKMNTKLSEHLLENKSHTKNIIYPPEVKKDQNTLFEPPKILSEEKQSKMLLKDAILSTKEMPSFLDNMNAKICSKNILNPCNKYIADLSNQLTKDENKSKDDTPKTNITSSIDKQSSSEKILIEELYPNKNQRILNLLTKTESHKEINSIKRAHSNEHVDKSIASSSAIISEHKSDTYEDKTLNNLLSSSSKSLEKNIDKATKDKNKQYKSEVLPSSNKHLEESIAYFTTQINENKIDIKKNTLSCNEQIEGNINYPGDKAKEEKCELFKSETFSSNGEHLGKSIASSDNTFKGETINNSWSPSNKHLERNTAYFSVQTNKEKNKISNNKSTCINELQGSIAYPVVKINEEKSAKSETKNNTLSPDSEHLEKDIASTIAKITDKSLKDETINNLLSPSNKHLDEKNSLKNDSLTCSNQLQGSIAYQAVKTNEEKTKTFSPNIEHLEKSLATSTTKITEGIIKAFKSEPIAKTLLPNNKHLEESIAHIAPKTNEEKNKIKYNKLTDINEHLERSPAYPVLKVTEGKRELFKSETKNNILFPSSEYLEKSITPSVVKTNEEASKSFKNIPLSPNNAHLEKNIAYFSTKTNDKLFDDKTVDMNSMHNSVIHNNESITSVSVKNKVEKSQKLSKEFLEEDTSLSLKQYSQHKKSIVNFLQCLDNYRGLNNVNNILAQNSKHVARIICSPRKTMQHYISNPTDNNITSKILSNIEKLPTNQSNQPKSSEPIYPSQNDNTKLIQSPQNPNQKKVPQLAIKIIVPSEKINSIVVKCSMDSLIKDKQSIKNVISKTNSIVSTKTEQKSNSIPTSAKETLDPQVLLKNQDKNAKSHQTRKNEENTNLDSVLLTSVKSHESYSKSIPKRIIVGNVFKGKPVIKEPSSSHYPSSTPVKENKFETLSKSLEPDKNIANFNVNIKPDSNLKITAIPQNANKSDSLLQNKDNYTKSIPKLVDRAEEKVDTLNKVNFSNANITKEVGMEGISISQQTNVKELTPLSKQNDAKMVLKEEKSSLEYKKKEAEILLEKARREQEIVNVQNFSMENKKQKEGLENQIDINYLTVVDDGKKYTTLDTYKKINDDNSLFTAGDSQNVKFTSTPQNKDTYVREQLTKEISFEKNNANTNEKEKENKANPNEKEKENKAKPNEKEREADALIKLFDKAIQAIESISVNNILNVRFKKVTTLSQKSNACEKNEKNDSTKYPLPETKKSIEIIMKPIENAKNNLKSISKDLNKQCDEINNKSNSTGLKNIQPHHKKVQEVKRLSSSTKPKSAEKSATRTISKNKSFTPKLAAKSLETIHLKAVPKKEISSPSDPTKSDKSQEKKIDSSQLKKKTPLKKVKDNVASKDDKNTVKNIKIQDNAMHREAMEKFEKEILETVIKNIPTKNKKPSKSDSKPPQKAEYDEKLKVINVKTSLVNENLTLTNANTILEQIKIVNPGTNNDSKKILGISIGEENVRKVLKLKDDFNVLEKLLKSNPEIISNNHQCNSSLCKKPQENLLLKTENISNELVSKDNIPSMNNKVVSKSMEIKCAPENIISEKMKGKSISKNEVISSSNYKKSKQDSSTILNKIIEKAPKNAKNFKFTSSKCVTPELIYESVKGINPSSNNKVGADVLKNSIITAISRKDIKPQKNMEIENPADSTCSPEKKPNSNIVKQFKSYDQNHDSVVTDSNLMVTTVVSEKPLCKYPKPDENDEEDEKICKSDDDDVQYDDSVCRVEEGECVINLTKEDQEFIEFRRNSSQYNGFINLAPSECVKDENGTYVYISTFDQETE